MEEINKLKERVTELEKQVETLSKKLRPITIKIDRLAENFIIEGNDTANNLETEILETVNKLVKSACQEN